MKRFIAALAAPIIAMGLASATPAVAVQPSAPTITVDNSTVQPLLTTRLGKNKSPYRPKCRCLRW